MAENKILLFKDTHIKWGAKTFDDGIDFTEVFKNKLAGKIAEKADKFVAEKTLNGLNNIVSPYISDEYKDEIHLALDDVIDGDKDYEVAINQAEAIILQLTAKINIQSKLLNNLFDALISMVLAALEIALEVKNAQ